MKRAGLLLALAAAAWGCSAGSRKMTSSELYLTERMAQVLLQQGNAPEAEPAFARALAQDPDNPEMRDGHGLALLMLGRPQDALLEFDRALKLAPNRGAYLNNRGAARLELGDFTGAEADFLAAYKSPVVGDRVSALINLGRARLRRGMYADSEDALTRAIALDPKSFDAYMARGATREARKDEVGAVSDFLDALRLKPDNPAAMLRVGLGLIQLKQDKLGRQYLRRLCELAPDSPEAGNARLVLGDEGDAPAPRSQP